MTSTSTHHFDFDSLSPDFAATLRLEIKRLRRLMGNQTSEMISLGHNLLAFKKWLKKNRCRKFVLLVDIQIGIGIRTAQLYMRMAELAGKIGEIISLLPPPIVRLLATKKTPAHIIEHVISQAASGQILALSTVEKLISDDKEARRTPQREAEAASRREKEKRVRAKRAAEKEIWRAEEEQRHLEDQAKAQSILARFSPEDARFLADMLTDAVVDELKKLVRDGGAE